MILCDLSFYIKYKLESGLRKFETLHLRMSYISCVNKTLAVSVKNDTADNLLLKDRKRNDKMNSQPTKQHICKPLQPTRNQSLQKSCFLADAPHEIDTFVVI